MSDAEQLCGKRYQRHVDRQAYRWGLIGTEIGWHGGKAAVRRPRLRHRGGGEVQLSNWKAIQEGGLAVALGVQPDADRCGDAQVRALGTTAGRRSGRRAMTNSSVSRRFVVLSTTKLKEWLAADLSGPVVARRGQEGASSGMG